MDVLFAIFLAVHGLIHLLGFAKAFGLAELPQLTHPVAPLMGVLWLMAALLFMATAASLFVWPRAWWAVGACAIVLSMCAVVASWTDARFGALANLIALAGVAFGFLALGPGSLRAAFDREIDGRLGAAAPIEPLTLQDVAHLPAPVQRYLEVTGVIGQPRVRNFRVRMHGRIRSGPDAHWIPFTAEQYNFIDRPARLFYLTGSMFMVPVQGLHRYVASAATMAVKAAALVPVVNATGSEMDRGETVTMFNDMCVMAPGTLAGAAIEWEAVDARTARATFTNAGQRIRAELSFNAAGELINFRSDDRYQISPDGRSARRLRWSTPLRGYRRFGPVRLAGGGEGRWHEADVEYAYIELTLDDIQYNRTSRR